jgi:dTDP-4-dehydrorhamnose reductase
MRVVLIGANGQLGQDLQRKLEAWDVIPITHADLEIRDFEAVEHLLDANKPDYVINTAAYHRVDDCEDDPLPAFEVNGFAVLNLAQVCAKYGITLVHISTDYVFDGRKTSPYTELDLANPLNVYGVSKLAGEYFVQNYCPEHIIVRTSGLYGVAGASGKGGNFIETMLRLAREEKPISVVADQTLSPTFTSDLAESIRELIQSGARGLFHVTNSGQTSWFEFAGAIFDSTGLTPELSRTTTEAFGAKAPRPAYSVLAHDRLLEHGLDDLRPWSLALNDYLGQKGHL